jgi:hypothetical protein
LALLAKKGVIGDDDAAATDAARGINEAGNIPEETAQHDDILTDGIIFLLLREV